MEIEDSLTGKTHTNKLKPNRLCVIAVLGGFVLVTCVYNYLHIAPQNNNLQRAVQDKISTINIVVNNKNPYNITLKSQFNVIQSLGVNNSQVEISIKDVLENNMENVLRVTRTGTTNDLHVSPKDNVSGKKYTLTNFDEIKPNINNIFFIESRCGLDEEFKKHSAEQGIVLNARQICAIESTARMNPKRPVYILHTCPLDHHFYEKSPKYFQELMSYPNVHIVFLKMSDMFMRTIVEELYFGHTFEQSAYPVAHMSDVMRILTLWKFGGTYMDIDVVSIRSLDDLGVNFAGWQDEYSVATGVMNFADSGFGHSFLTKYLEHLKHNYDPHNWSTNGPLLFTKLLSDICHIYTVKSKSKDFTAYDIPIFYPIYYNRYQLFFEEDKSDYTLNELNQTYIVHLWNKMSSNTVVNVGSKQAYAILADKYCPKAYHNCGPTF